MDKKEKVSIGLIGFGLAGRIFHAPFIEAVDGLELKAVQVSCEKNIEFAKRDYPNAKIYGETSALSAMSDYRKFFENIRDAVLQNVLLVTATDGANTIKIIETAIQSDKEKRTIAFS